MQVPWDDRSTPFYKTLLKAKPITTDKSLYFYRRDINREFIRGIAIYVNDCIYSGIQDFQST